MPADPIHFTNLVHGRLTVPTNAIGHFLLVLEHGAPLDPLAVAVTDARIHITHVLRDEHELRGEYGDESTPAPILLYRGSREPMFGHFPEFDIGKRNG